MTQRPYNFSAGPSALPDAVLQKAKDEMMNWRNTGVSAMEIGHRTPVFEAFLQELIGRVRELLSVPANYHVLFLQGGAQVQFATIPMNLLGKNQTADYVDSGTWSQKAFQEAQKYGDINLAVKVPATQPLRVPDVSTWKLSKDAAYLYYTDNETIEGIEFNHAPSVGNVPLVCDMTSNILSRKINVADFGIIFASAQKNMGISGLTLVIVRDDLLNRALKTTPAVFDYAVQVKQQSMANTPPTYAIYMMNLMCEWVKEHGGVSAFEALSQRKAKKLYDAIDSSHFYSNHVDKQFRSRMNVIFTLPDERLDKPFLTQADERGLLNLKGHRSVGGMRASIYNAIPEVAVDALVDFMRDFAKKNG
jgi:phosphoserine aminotransferase